MFDAFVPTSWIQHDCDSSSTEDSNPRKHTTTKRWHCDSYRISYERVGTVARDDVNLDAARLTPLKSARYLVFFYLMSVAELCLTTKTPRTGLP